MRGVAIAALVLLPLAAQAAADAPPDAPLNTPLGGPAANDYPTAARADYVLACMNVNGGTQQAMASCSCSIDVIASILPYSGYEAAETVLRMRRLGGGYLAGEFRVGGANTIVHDLQEAQAEAEVRCF